MPSCKRNFFILYVPSLIGSVAKTTSRLDPAGFLFHTEDKLHSNGLAISTQMPK